MKIICPALLLFLALPSRAQKTPAPAAKTPRIVNIVNFIRLLEPRDSAITEDVLYQTVVSQIALMRQYRLRGTFLLQYDALMDPRYERLLGSLPRDSFEIGGWWELPQPLVEKAGMHWRGRYPWDWRANIGFSTGYTPAEREKLIDVYMADFLRIFGYYPSTVGSWFIDAHSLDYLATRYHITASCNCKDQYGTDGYTLWGGYWNQAYYPSKINSYMPAQRPEQQIDVPIFRMLGSDPIRQYDNGLGGSRQGVVTLEPVYAFGGGDPVWVKWFFDAFTSGADLGFNYTQAGQENSFTWQAMAKGLQIQFPLIAQLRDAGRLQVETMAETGRWFRSTYPVTPATSFTVLKDIDGSDKSTIWYDSRFYRVNLLWEGSALRIRDIHLFDARLPSIYETEPAHSNECRFFTLPVVDGYLWSKPGQLAGIRLKAMIGGSAVLLEGGDPTVIPEGDSAMLIRWPLKTVAGELVIRLTPDRIGMSLTGAGDIKWFLELNTANDVTLPFVAVDPNGIDCLFEGMKYRVRVEHGSCEKPRSDEVRGAGGQDILRIRPGGPGILIDMR